MLKILLFYPLLSVTEASGCDSSPCLNGGTCYDIGESGYECICSSFAGKNCQIPPPSVSCESSSITIDIDRSWLMEKVKSDNHRHIYMGQGQGDNEGCKAVVKDSDATHLEVKLDKNFRQCGTKMSRSDDGNFVYQNTVFMNLQSAGIQTGLAALVQWTCEYEDQYTVSYDNLNPTAQRDDRAKARGIIGDFDLTLRPFVKPIFTADNLMTSYITPGSDQIFHVIPTDKKWISFQAAMTGEAQLRGSRVSLQKCFISSSRSPFSTLELVELVQDGCATVEGVSHMYSNGQSTVAQFATNIRKFKEKWMEHTPFYFHCQTQLCPAGENCPAGCSQEITVEEAKPKGDPLMVHISSGPYFFQGSKALIDRSNPRATLESEDAEHSYGAEQFMGNAISPNETEDDVKTDIESDKVQTLPLVGALAIISLLAILVISGLITIFNRRNQKKETKNKRTGNQIDINFAHEGSLRATKYSAGYSTVVANGRPLHLPVARPVGFTRPNYV